MALKKCKYCKEEFKQFKSTQVVCSYECTVELAKLRVEKVEALKWVKEKRERKEALKTKSDWLKEVQVIFNKFIRLRDKGLNCISCNKTAKKENAGHYRSRGGNPELALDELNCHLQCEYCNTFLHGNLIDYRINLIKKVGIENVEWLEGKHEPKHYSIEELKELKEVYKQKIKEL